MRTGATFMSRATSQTTMTDCPWEPGARRGLVRNWLFAGAGVVCVGLGALGVVVPGLPTTGFLIMASWLFTKSCPWLERKLIRNRFFGPYLKYLDGNARMPRKAKAIAIGTMWFFVAMSSVILYEAVHGVWLPLLVIGAACIGTLFIARQGGRVEAGPEAETGAGETTVSAVAA